jgi:hypothetical protein
VDPSGIAERRTASRRWRGEVPQLRRACAFALVTLATVSLTSGAVGQAGTGENSALPLAVCGSCDLSVLRLDYAVFGQETTRKPQMKCERITPQGQSCHQVGATLKRNPFAETGTLEELIAPNGWIREVLRPTRTNAPAVELASGRLDAVIVLDSTNRTAEVYRPFYRGLRSGRWGGTPLFTPTNTLFRFEIETLSLVQPTSDSGTSYMSGTAIVGRGLIDGFPCAHYRSRYVGLENVGETRFWACTDPASRTRFFGTWRWHDNFGDAGTVFVTHRSRVSLTGAQRHYMVAARLFQIPPSYKVVHR